ncbi:MAG: hypothetical protein H6642_16445 [Caldilineaceae bacterium]|nr:hypothetical protein [Caldilineaceae bacterium]MCB9139934.1 hypothetical protein [Caldilineaceae bacterium]
MQPVNQPSPRANVKPLTHWLIYRGYSVRFHARNRDRVTGVITTPDGTADFVYDPANLVVTLPDERIRINEHGWELEKEALDA